MTTDILSEVTKLVAQADSRTIKQETELDKYRDENGDVPEQNLWDYDELRVDQYEDDAYQLGLLVDRLRELTATASS